jgi:hypothetical protein
MKQAMRMGCMLVVASAAALSSAAAQELSPPQPGFAITFRYSATKGAAPGDDTFRVVAVDGPRSTAEVDRAGTPPSRYTLHSYRLWYSERIVQPLGTLFQDSPTEIIDEFAVLKPGMVRAFPAKLRFEADPAVPTLPNGQPNRSYAFDLDMTYAVERTERVSVPAGDFDSFVLLRTQAIANASGHVFRRDVSRIWYAPALRWWVKIEQSSSALPDATTTGVAIEIRRP